MRSFLVVFAIGLAALAVVGLTQRSSVQYTLGVNPALAAATLAPGDQACQAPIRPPSGTTFDAVGFRVSSFGKPARRSASPSSTTPRARVSAPARCAAGTRTPTR